MSEQHAELEGLVHEASGIVVAAGGKVKITKAMALVGVTSPERRNMKIYQKVRRRSLKVAVVERGKHANAPVILLDSQEEVSPMPQAYQEQVQEILQWQQVQRLDFPCLFQ
jgi:hypothetical protein